MKIRTFDKKLSLKKQTVTNLNREVLKNVKGGIATFWIDGAMCETYTCWNTCNTCIDNCNPVVTTTGGGGETGGDTFIPTQDTL